MFQGSCRNNKQVGLMNFVLPGLETCLLNGHKAFQPIRQAERQPFGTDIQNASPDLGSNRQVFEL